jgi:TPR repeat protein
MSESKGDEVPLSEKSTSSTDIASESSIHQSLRSPHQSIESTVALGGKAFLLKIETPHYEGDASEYIDRRIAAARAGDAQSSYEIHNRIASCKRALNSGDADEYKAYASVEIGQEIGHCQGLIGRTELGDENWLSLAAAQGSVEARLIFAKDPKAIIGNLTEALKDPERIANYRRDAIDYLNESVSQGSVDSIEALADIHDRGIIADKSPEKSLAYWLAYQRANPNSQSAASIARLSKLLQPNQIERSNEMSEAIYRSCCL